MSRGELLTELADDIRQLVEPRLHTEYLEATIVTALPAVNGRRKSKRTRQRRRHTVQLPSLLDMLRTAMVPGASDDTASGAGFESRPSAELGPVDVLRDIAADADHWAVTLGVHRETLADLLSALVGARHTDTQLAQLAGDAARWVQRARIAVGVDPEPITIGGKCVYCGRRNTLVIAGDLKSAKCSRCKVEWTHDTIGLLAEMLTANQTQETMVTYRCWHRDCRLRGEHERHQDWRGNDWAETDSCPIAVGE